MVEKTSNSFGVEYISCSIAIIHEHGLLAAALYGLIWSKTQLKNKKCYASETQLGKELGGVSRQTISKYVQILEDADLIKVLSREKHYHKAEVNNNNGKGNFSGRVLTIICNHENVKRLDDMLELEIKIMRRKNLDDEDFDRQKTYPDANDIVLDL